VGRETAALEELSQNLTSTYGTPIEVLTADILSAEDLTRVEERLQNEAQPIDLLVNSAAFGLGLDFEHNELEEEVTHIRIPDEVPMRLTHRALQVMLKRQIDYIINAASVAASIPRSTYSAVKQSL